MVGETPSLTQTSHAKGLWPSAHHSAMVSANPVTAAASGLNNKEIAAQFKVCTHTAHFAQSFFPRGGSMASMTNHGPVPRARSKTMRSLQSYERRLRPGPKALPTGWSGGPWPRVEPSRRLAVTKNYRIIALAIVNVCTAFGCGFIFAQWLSGRAPTGEDFFFIFIFVLGFTLFVTLVRGQLWFREM